VYQNTLSFTVGVLSVVGIAVSAVTLVIQLSGSSDMPERLNIYSYLGLAGAAASIAGLIYALNYRTSEEIVELLAPLGFVAADSGLFGRDGKYDAKGSVNGIEVLVNLSQNEPYRDSPPSFWVTAQCRVANPAGLRLFIRLGSYLKAPLGSPLGFKKIESPDWAGYSVSGGPEADMISLLPRLKRAGAAIFGENDGFVSLRLEGEKLKVDISRPGRPDEDFAKMLVESAAAAARVFD
jgi:hypothetical protein